MGIICTMGYDFVLVIVLVLLLILFLYLIRTQKCNKQVQIK